MSIIIGITHSYENNLFKINADYIKAISEFGATGLVFSYYENPDDILNISDGIILSGGGDLSEYLICEKLSPKARDIHIERDIFEKDLCRKAFERDIPLLGICRGIQVMNTAMGGSILQHIEGHIYKDKKSASHNIHIEKDSFLYDIAGDSAFVNSYHHQCVSDIAPVFKISAKAGEITEAIECPEKSFFAGVQWHPEKMYGDKLSRGIFKLFTEKCAERKLSRR